MKKRLTVDDIMKWIQCVGWTKEKVQEKFGKRKTVTPLQLAKAEGIEAQDKLWILLRPEIIYKKKLQYLACAFIKREASTEHLADARNAVWNGRDTAWTSWNAAWTAARASWNAAWTAARSARDVTHAARNASWNKYLKMTIKVLEEI